MPMLGCLALQEKNQDMRMDNIKRKISDGMKLQSRASGEGGCCSS